MGQHANARPGRSGSGAAAFVAAGERRTNGTEVDALSTGSPVELNGTLVGSDLRGLACRANAGPLRRVTEAARSSTGLALKALTVLAVQNDPYRCDTPAGHRYGAWVAEQFERARRPRIHLRGLHYAIVVRGNVRKPDSENYVNDEANWTWLQSTAAKAVRWLGYVPFAAITNERNAAPFIHRQGRSTPDTWISVWARS